MGRILTSQRITQGNIEHYIEQSTKDYSTFLGSSPVFCTYYSRNHLKSTYDTSLENVHEVVGADSPNVFNKIDSFPIYKLDNASFSREVTDFGIVGNVASSAVVLPDTVVPAIDDLIFIDYQNDRKVFIVIDVEQDNYNNSKYFKVSFKLSQYNIEDLTAQVGGEYTIDFNLIGAGGSPVVKTSFYDLGLALEDICDALAREYVDTYYSREATAFVDTTGDDDKRMVLDPMVNFFINSEKLCTPYSNYRTFLYVKSEVLQNIRMKDLNKSVYGAFKNSLFADILTSLPTKFTQRRHLLQMDSTTNYSTNWWAKTNYFVSIPVKEDFIFTPLSEMLEPMAPEFMASIAANDFTSENPYKKFIVKALNGYYTKEKYHEIADDVGFTDDYEDNYYIVPLVLFCLKHYLKMVVKP